MKYLSLLLVLFFASLMVESQVPPPWWQTVHGYDGSRTMYDYLTYTPSYFGPNALPIPELYDGRVPRKNSAELSTDVFWGFGDQTQSLSLRLDWSPLPGRVSFSGWGILAEQYRTTDAVRDVRASSVESGKGSVIIGDLYLASMVRLLRETKKSPDLNLEVALKTAASQSPWDARFMDTPGYWFNLIGGKSVYIKGAWLDEVRLVANYGFLCYQLNTNHQNDAPMFGGKILFTAGSWTFESGIHGYSGWLEQGDKPLALRTKLTYDIGVGRVFVQYQHALRDYPFRRIQTGLKLNLDFKSTKQQRMKTFNFLTSDEKEVLLNKATERAFTGKYVNFDEEGTYTCKQCGTPLYKSSDKFKSDCGWPSFDDALPNAVKRIPDADGRRTEIVCANCGGHLGHVFEGEGFTPKDTRYCVNSISLNFTKYKVDKIKHLETAIFAGGCFWGVEHLMQKAPGVISVVSGYTGGHTDHPTYQQVCNHKTGHAEAVKITFDPDSTDYETLAKLFFEIHDPTQTDGQGPDIGDQYRSEVFYTTPKQKEIAEKLISILKAKGYWVVTQVTPATTFWEAESYHQDYYDHKGAEPYCHIYTKRF